LQKQIQYQMKQPERAKTTKANDNVELALAA
jgi:hypothetical protein